jgi:hypothetical protein
MTRSIIALSLVLFSTASLAGSRVGHHGGLIVDCEPPHFFDQTPAKDSKVGSIQDFSVVASDNTDGETIKVWANNEPVEVKITQQRSGQYLIEGHLKEPVVKGKVWFRVNAESHDGCDNNGNWNVYIGN